jgi:hypothetical protein
MDILPTPTPEQLEQMRNIEILPEQERQSLVRDLEAQIRTHEGALVWCRFLASGLNRKAGGDPAASGPPDSTTEPRAPTRRTQGVPTTTAVPRGRTRTAPHLPPGLTREQVPRINLREGEDRTGRKRLILGVMLLTLDWLWSPREIADALKWSGLDPGITRDSALTSMRRMAVADPPRLVKRGIGRGARYELAPDLRPTEQAEDKPAAH